MSLAGVKRYPPGSRPMSGTIKRSFESRIAGSGVPSWRPGQKWRSWASAAAWNVRAITPRWPSVASRATISPAALSVNVTSRIWSDGTAPVSMAYAARRLMTRVLPEPAPATIASRPAVAVTASRCDGLRSSSRRSAEMAAVNGSDLEEGQPPTTRGSDRSLPAGHSPGLTADSVEVDRGSSVMAGRRAVDEPILWASRASRAEASERSADRPGRAAGLRRTR